MKFLNKISNKNPKANSKPAKLKIKNVNETKFISSLHAPKIIVNTYKLNHVISENNNKFKKLLGLNKKLNKTSQNSKFQKFNHVCISRLL